MGKGSSKAPTPPDPYKTASTEAQFNRLDTYSPSGSGVRYGYTDANGRFIQGVAPEGRQSAVSTVESPWEQRIRQTLEPASVNLVGRIVSDNIDNMPEAARAGALPGVTSVPDRGTVAQSIYDRTLSMMRPEIDRQNSRLLTNLQARGIPVGGDAFNEAMESQQRNTQDTVARLAMDADIAGGQEQTRLFGLGATQFGQGMDRQTTDFAQQASARQGAIAELVAAMGGSYNPPSATPTGNAAGVGYANLANTQYGQQLAQYEQNQQNRASAAGTIGNIGAALLTKSDRLFKRDVVEIGRRGRFTLYEYRYLWDRPGTRRRGYMVQDVARIMPEAVVRVGRWLALDYSMLPEVS